MEYRMEHDTMGQVAVPADKLWGAQTQRSFENFPIGEEKMPADLITAFGVLKEACAAANHKLGKLDDTRYALIQSACQAIRAGELAEHFPLAVWQTGSGTQTNMNCNEVIARYGDAFHPKRENWEPLRGDIEFRDVTFRYPDGGEDVLSHFSLKIPAGTTVAIVGETGAGKSTLVNLACRFFEPTSGQILIDGRDYRERSQLWLHSNIGYVLQNPHLFSGSVRENIRYGKLDATDDEVEAAARAVSVDTVVAKLENGWDSDVGEGGDRLSTGEKQLISFARAVLADPRIFVLDEATSSIDTQTEQLIQNAIDHLLTNRTSFLVAHRLSTIRKADVILVVKDGHIVEQGKHEELLRRKGYYHDLYSKQFAQESAARILGEGSAQ